MIQFRKFSLIMMYITLFSFLGHAQEKQMNKAAAVVDKAVNETDKQKQNELLQKANDMYKDIKMLKEGAKVIGDAFFEKGDLTMAARYYVKCDKEAKKEGYERVGKAYIEEAFTDKKTEAKTMKKALDNLSKGIGMGEACRVVGDAYFDKGEEYFPNAQTYYLMGGHTEGVRRIADLYFANPSTKTKAAEIYALTKTREGYKIAGDIYYERKDYGKAFEYYNLGGDVEGFKKYADAMFEQGKLADANSMYERVADSLKAKEKFDDLRTMATTSVQQGNYLLASRLYLKLADASSAGRYEAYDKLMNMNYFEARDILKKQNIMDLPKAIDASTALLQNLQQYDMIFQDLQRGAPEIRFKEDPKTKELVKEQNDVKALEDYYMGAKDGIVDNVYKVSESVMKIVNPELKKLMIQKFSRYAAVKKILDHNTFAKKLLKPQIVLTDVYL